MSSQRCHRSKGLCRGAVNEALCALLVLGLPSCSTDPVSRRDLSSPAPMPPLTSAEPGDRRIDARVAIAVATAPGQGELDIWTADADGGNATEIATSAADEFSPVWSPDGTKIAYRVETSTTQPDIWVMNADGSHKRNLTRTPHATEWGPSWTPDGRRIVYSYDDDDESTGGIGLDVWIMDADGSNKEPLHTDPRHSDEYAEYSPDARLIVLISFATAFAIWTMSADGTHKRRITPWADNSSFPRWSPDGSLIAFHSERDGGPDRHDIFIMRPDGSGAQNVTNTPDVDELFATWLPDGYISFMRVTDDLTTDLWVAHRDGTDAHLVIRDAVGPHSWTEA